MLPRNITVLERGWLSSNNILVCGAESTALIDSGYCTHARQTLALVAAGLGGRQLDTLVNTHLHSDHCGGNSALQTTYPDMRTFIPPGLAAQVRAWDPEALTYGPTGQSCPRFRFDALLAPGSEITLGGIEWQVHAAPGHDPHSIILFDAANGILISADALWEHGFGVVFPELEGTDAFEQVAATIDLIESLSAKTVIPGHGRVFSDVAAAIGRARMRLDAYASKPARHIQHAAKVLLKFKLLELQAVELPEFIAWARSTAYFLNIHRRHFPDTDFDHWVEDLAGELVKSGAAVREGLQIRNA